jgi:GNAT superfamily N-acetyltransferase
MSATIRFATPADAPTIYQFIYDLAVYEREPEAVEVTAEILASQMASERPPFECLIIEDDSLPGRGADGSLQAAGFALFFPTYSTWRGRAGIHLEDLYVPVELRGRGYGLALLKRLAELTEERGFARLEWAVLDWNQSAIDFYESLGAVRMGEWFTYRLTDAPLTQLVTRELG